MQARTGLILIIVGLMLGFVGAVWLFNLFGVASVHAQRIRKFWGFGSDNQAADMGVKAGRYLVGGGWMLVGLAMVIGGLVSLLSGSD